MILLKTHIRACSALLKITPKLLYCLSRKFKFLTASFPFWSHFCSLVSVILNSLVSQAPGLFCHISRPSNVPPTFLLEIPFLFLFAQREDSYLSSRPCPGGSPGLSGHDPSPTGGWELSYLCSHKNFDNSEYATCCQTPSPPWRWALHSQTSDCLAPGRSGGVNLELATSGNSLIARNTPVE